MAAARYPLNRAPAPGQRSKFAPDKEALSCAGQKCQDRMKCLKYRRHAAYWGLQRWASFDIERQRIDSRFCPAFEQI